MSHLWFGNVKANGQVLSPQPAANVIEVATFPAIVTFTASWWASVGAEPTEPLADLFFDFSTSPSLTDFTEENAGFVGAIPKPQNPVDFGHANIKNVSFQRTITAALTGNVLVDVLTSFPDYYSGGSYDPDSLDWLDVQADTASFNLTIQLMAGSPTPMACRPQLWIVTTDGKIMRWQDTATSDAGTAIPEWEYSTGFDRPGVMTKVNSVFAEVDGAPIECFLHPDMTGEHSAKQTFETGAAELPMAPNAKSRRWRLRFRGKNTAKLKFASWERELLDTKGK